MRQVTAIDQNEVVFTSVSSIILESRDDIRVVFTDVNMPGSMDGAGLAGIVRHRWPPIESSSLLAASLWERTPCLNGASFS